MMYCSTDSPLKARKSVFRPTPPVMAMSRRAFFSMTAQTSPKDFCSTGRACQGSTAVNSWTARCFAVPGDNYWSHLAGSPVHGDATYDRLGAGFTKATTTGDATGLRQGSSPLSVKDFLLDRATLIGREVSVQGDAQCSGTACWLTQEFTETTNCQLQGRRSPRADRKRLLDCDQLFSHGCAATVTGLVSGNELNAATIQWR